jgi:hypothetical protein
LPERTTLRPGLRSFKTVTNFYSRQRKKTDSATNRLVVVIIAEVIELERPGPGGVKRVKLWTVGDIEGVVGAHRAKRNSSTHLKAEGSLWQDPIVDSERSIWQLVDPKRLEAFYKHIAWG